MRTTPFDERYSAGFDPFPSARKDNSLRLGRLRRYLPDAMEDLTARQRQIVHLHYYENLSVSEIANLCGFDDPLYYSRLFTRKYGTSPTRYRKDKS